MAQQIIPIRFAFIRLPVTWEVLSVPKGLVLCGQLKKIKSIESGVLKELNGWHWRDEFLSLPENDLDRLTAFLNEVGAWPASGDPNPNTPGHAMKFPVIVQPEDVWHFREDLNHALLDRNQKWFKETVAPVLSRPKTWLDLYSSQPANDFHLRFELSDVAAGVVTLTNARHMLFATVLADVARGIRFKTCKRKDCRKPFPIETEHKRDYCKPYCGHLVSLRKKREDAKKERAARLNKKKSRKSLR